MKTIAQFLQDGIASIADLKAALQTSIQLEFSTIPPYLCAEWSIDFNNDPDDVTSMIHGIVVQEMFHFALAGNILSAIGGTPAIAHPDFLLTYPTNSLPGDIQQNLAVDLQPLSLDQLQVFMQIEYPEFPPVALRARRVATIGAFYEAISTAFSAIEPAIDPNAHYVAYGGSVGQIRTIDDALAAIGRIKQEGEGTANSPDQPSINGERFAHYYMFKEIFEGRKLINTGGKWSFAGDMIRFPTVHNFTRSSASPNPSLAFNQQLAQLLTNLEACWTSGRLPDIDGMTQLQQQGIDLVQNGIRPDFVWAPSLLAKQMSG
ncbi:MAG: hypothetical protein C5B58_16415 [Acidobacteria bacterium]|nr:MAG: hypothetical protein C5B58_16415 [Acidobacteriota bacterium]